MKKVAFALVGAALLALGGAGTSASAQSSTPASAQPSTTLPTDLMDVTCGQYMLATRIADAGMNPSQKRKRQAEEAQDAIGDAMLWVHGFQSGRAGAPGPLTSEWIRDTVGKVIKSCGTNSPDGSMRLADAVARL